MRRGMLARVSIVVAILLSILHYVLAADAYSQVNTSSIAEAFSRIYEASLHGANVSKASELLSVAAQCMNEGNYSCASMLLSEAEEALANASAPRGQGLYRALKAGLALSVPVAAWLLLPWLYAVTWLWARRGWLVVEDGRRLWSLVEEHGLSRALRLYREIVERAELHVADPSPPRDFLEYLSRASYSAWFWTSMALAASGAVLALADVGGYLAGLRLVLGLVYVFFLPGYSMAEALYPREDSLDPVEHMALSIGLSLALVPLLGLVLNFTPWHVRSVPVIVFLLVFTATMLLVAAYRKYMLQKG